MQAYVSARVPEEFAASLAKFGQVVEFLGGQQAAVMTHGQMEQWLDCDGGLLLRQMYQDSMDLRASREQRIEQVIDADGDERGSTETGRRRGLATIFGQVSVARIAYRQRGLPDLHPADAVLNLPVEKHSHGLRRLAALEAARGSYEAAAAAIGRATGPSGGKRQRREAAL